MASAWPPDSTAGLPDGVFPGVTEYFHAAARDDFRARFTYAFGAMSKHVKGSLKVACRQGRAGGSSFWIQVSQAGKWLLSPREARKRAVIRLLDAMGNEGQTPARQDKGLTAG
jgi:hypothetical protein